MFGGHLQEETVCTGEDAVPWGICPSLWGTQREGERVEEVVKDAEPSTHPERP